MDRSFDIEYWQRLGPEAIQEAAWQMVVDAHRMKGGSEDELRMQRTVEMRFTKDLDVWIEARGENAAKIC